MNNITRQLSATVNGFIVQYSSQINRTDRPAPGQWSAIEILGHLTDSALVNLHRFVRCTYESDFTLTYAQDEWVAAQHYQDADITELLTLWQLINRRIIAVLDTYPPDRWLVKCNDQTVEFLAGDYVEHMRHHLSQIIARQNSL